MTKLFDESGNVVDALTQDEVNAKLEETRLFAIEETNKLREEEISDLTTQSEAKEQELEDAKRELEAEKSKDKNLAGQRGVIEQKSKEVQVLQEQVAGLTKTIETKFSEQDTKNLNKTASTLISGLAGGDKNVVDKIKFFYDSFKPIDATNKTSEQVEEEVKQRVNNAFIIVSGGVKPYNLLNSNVIAAGRGVMPINPTGEKLSEGGAAVAAAFGVTPQDLAKHKLI